MSLPYVIVLGFLNALWIVGVFYAFTPGQILGEVGDFLGGNYKVSPPLESHAPDWFTKPLFMCPRCMASVHGALWWICFSMGPWYILPFYVVCLSGLMNCVTITILNHDHES